MSGHHVGIKYSFLGTNYLFDSLCGLVFQNSWLQIQRSGFDSWHYQSFWEVVGLEWGPLSLESTVEELLEKKSSDSGLGSRDYGHRDLPR
jgi:hypothetical protein